MTWGCFKVKEKNTSGDSISNSQVYAMIATFIIPNQHNYSSCLKR